MHTVTDVCFGPVCLCFCVVHIHVGQSHINQSIPMIGPTAHVYGVHAFNHTSKKTPSRLLDHMRVDWRAYSAQVCSSIWTEAGPGLIKLMFGGGARHFCCACKCLYSANV